VQGALAAAFVVLGQAGTTVKGAYDVLVSMGVIAFFIPYLFMFAAMVKAQWEPAAPGVSRVPGGRPVGAALGALGFLTTAVSIYLACLPSRDSENPAGDVVKIVGASLALVAVGALIYAAGTARRRRRAGWKPRRRTGKRKRRGRR
jgi:glutamate:GABA antiporter